MSRAGLPLAIEIAIAAALGGCAADGRQAASFPPVAVGWTSRPDALGEPQVFWGDERGRLVLALLCARAVPEIVVQAVDERTARAAEPMSLWVAGHRFSLTARRAEGFVEGRLPLADGVREEILGAGRLDVEAMNRSARVSVPVSPEVRRLVTGCQRRITPAKVEVAPAAPARQSRKPDGEN